MTSDTPPSDDTRSELTEPESATEDSGAQSGVDSGPESSGPIDRLVTRLVERWRTTLLLVSVCAAVGLAAGLFVVQYLPDRLIDEAAAQRAIRAASEGAVATLSYSSDTIDRDFAKARSHLTGDFLAYYDKFTKEFVLPAVQNKHLKQTAVVVRAAVSELEPDSAVVLVFLNETTVSKDKPQPLVTPGGVRITLTKASGSWLISKLDPVV